MGNVISSTRAMNTSWWSSSSNGHVPMATSNEDDKEDSGDSDEESKREMMPTTSRTLSPEKAKEMEEFRKQLLAKREARRKIIAERSREMLKLKQQLEEETRLREEVVNENKRLHALIAENSSGNGGQVEQSEPKQLEPSVEFQASLDSLEQQIQQLRDQNKSIRCELAECNLTNQSVMADLAFVNKENYELRKHVDSLKDVNKVSKDMLSIRESQLTQLKEKLVEIEKSLADREMRTLSNDLRSEYERQLENIRNLRVLYEERARVAEVTRQNLLRDLDEQKVLVDFHTKKCGELETKIEELEKEVSDKNDILGTTEDQLGSSKAETRGLKDEMTVINQLFSKMLLGFNNNQNLDKLVLRLEENHDLLTDMVVREESSEVASALPKLILDLLNQSEVGTNVSNTDNDTGDMTCSLEQENSISKGVTSAQEIVGNLPKVWKVLMELLSHQAGPQLVVEEGEKTKDICYKSIETPSGPRLVPSVSKTYIRLKDLILEKKSLQKEMTHLRQLNGHLENRLQDQERRLGLVSSELNKTWHIVGRMQRQHQQLHSHEQILRFELQQKRILLKELREELEYCKEKWDKAKQKNSESQIEWDKLRLEFASRKVNSTDSFNNSAESGYSDEKPSDDESIDCNNEKKIERKRFKKKSKSPEAEELDSKSLTNKILELSAGETNDSDDIADHFSDADEQEKSDLNSNAEKLPSSGEVSKQNSRLSSLEKDTSRTSPSTSGTSTSNYDDVLAARSARLKKLEEQCYVLVHKVTKTNNKGVELCNRLEELHTQYGGSDDSTEPSVEKEILNNITPEHQNGEDNSVESNSTNLSLVESEPCSSGSNMCSNINDQEVLDTINHTEDIKNLDETNNDTPSSGKYDYEAKFAARDARFKIMEEQAKSLVKKVTDTSTRSTEISSKLTDLHNHYGRSEDSTSDEINSNLSDQPLACSMIENSNTVTDSTSVANNISLDAEVQSNESTTEVPNENGEVRSP